jgi:hypothetical protein
MQLHSIRYGAETKCNKPLVVPYLAATVEFNAYRLCRYNTHSSGDTFNWILKPEYAELKLH